MSEGNGYEVVERPKYGPNTRRGAGLVGAIEATVQTGQAIRLPIKRRSYIGSALYGRMKRRGLFLRTLKEGDHLIVWAEPR